MHQVEAILFHIQNPFVYSALKAIDATCGEYLIKDDGVLYHASPIWRLVDSHIVRLSEVPYSVMQEFPHIIKAVQKIHDEAKADQEAWQNTKGSGARKTHNDVRNLSEAPHITKATEMLLKMWHSK